MVDHVSGKVVSGVLAQGVQNKLRKRESVQKQDLTETFNNSEIFSSAKEKIISLSKKSGLRSLNALTVAK